MLDFILNIATYVGSIVGAIAVALNQGVTDFGSQAITFGIYSALSAGLVFGSMALRRQFRRRYATVVTYEISFPDVEEEKAFDEVLQRIYDISPTKKHFELKREFERQKVGYKEKRFYAINRGTFFLWVKFRPLWITYKVDVKDTGVVRSLSFRAYFLSKEAITDIIGEVKSSAKPEEHRYRYLALKPESEAGAFLLVRSSRVQIEERVYYLPPRMRKIVDGACNNYINAKKDLSLRGITNKLNVLAYGPPGMGKSVIADYISQKLKKNILVPFCSGYASVTNFGRTGVRLDAIVFLDELDGILSNDQYNPDNRTTSSVINDNKVREMQSVLEGSLTVEDQVFVCTTNHPAKLGDAMLRNSRIDLLLRMDYWVKEDIDGWFNYYYPGCEHVAYSFPDSYLFRTCDMAHLYKQYPTNFAAFVNEMRTLDQSKIEGYDKWDKLIPITPTGDPEMIHSTSTF